MRGGGHPWTAKQVAKRLDALGFERIEAESAAGCAGLQMGGGRQAQIVAALAGAIGGVAFSGGKLFQYVSFDYLWMASGIARLVGCPFSLIPPLLDENWQATDWSRPQAEQVLKRIDSVLEALPAAVKQAHKRIIGERQVANNEKLLSLFEPDIHVNVRGKAGAEVEFGNLLVLANREMG